MGSYDFLSQLVDYDDQDLEKLHAFLQMLLPRLRGQEPDPVLIDGAVRLAGYKLVNKREHTIELEKGESKALDPLSAGGGEAWEDPRQKLSEIIKKIHSLFTGKYSDAEVAGWFTAVAGNVVADERIQMQAKANPTAGQFANGDYKLVLGQAIAKALASHHAMSEQTLQNPKVFEEGAEALLVDVYEKARAAHMSAG